MQAEHKGLRLRVPLPGRGPQTAEKLAEVKGSGKWVVEKSHIQKYAQGLRHNYANWGSASTGPFFLLVSEVHKCIDQLSSFFPVLLCVIRCISGINITMYLCRGQNIEMEL